MFALAQPSLLSRTCGWEMIQNFGADSHPPCTRSGWSLFDVKFTALLADSLWHRPRLALAAWSDIDLSTYPRAVVFGHAGEACKSVSTCFARRTWPTSPLIFHHSLQDQSTLHLRMPVIAA